MGKNRRPNKDTAMTSIINNHFDLPSETSAASSVATEIPATDAPGFTQPAALPITVPMIPVDQNQLPITASSSAQITIQELKDYITKMSSKTRMSTQDGGAVQSNLYHTLIQAINTPAEDFEATFGLTLKLIRDNLNGVFSYENMHRYTPHATLPAKPMAHFRYLLSVLTAWADPKLRQQAMRQTNVERAFRAPNIKEAARQRVYAYFNL